MAQLYIFYYSRSSDPGYVDFFFLSLVASRCILSGFGTFLVARCLVRRTAIILSFAVFGEFLYYVLSTVTYVAFIPYGRHACYLTIIHFDSSLLCGNISVFFFYV